MTEHEHEHYFAIRKTILATGEIKWLSGRVYGGYMGSRRAKNSFYEKESYERVEWSAEAWPSWFKTLGDAKRRLRTRAVRLDKTDKSVRWDVVEVTLTAYTKVVHTTEEDVVAKLAILAEEAA
jgi:hypothetical protein